MPVERLLPTEEAADLIVLARNVADKVLTPIVDGHEKAESYPEGVFAQLGAAGLLSLSRCTCRYSRRSPPGGPRSRWR